MPRKKNTHSHSYKRSAIIIIGYSLTSLIHGSKPHHNPIPPHPGLSQAGAFHKVLKANPTQKIGQMGGPAKEQDRKADNAQAGAQIKSSSVTHNQTQSIKPACASIQIHADEEHSESPMYTIHKAAHLGYELKLYYQLLRSRQLMLQDVGDLFRCARESYEQLKRLDAQQAQTLWKQFNQHNEHFYKILLNYYKEKIGVLLKCKLQYNAALKEHTQDKIEVFIFKKTNGWHDFVSKSNQLKSLFSGTTHEYFSQPICKQFASKYRYQIKKINKQVYTVLARLDAAIKLCMYDIDKKGDHKLIPTFIALSRQFDDMNEYLIAGLTGYEKKRHEYQDLLKKKNAKAGHERPHK